MKNDNQIYSCLKISWRKLLDVSLWTTHYIERLFRWNFRRIQSLRSNGYKINLKVKNEYFLFYFCALFLQVTYYYNDHFEFWMITYETLLNLINWYRCRIHTYRMIIYDYTMFSAQNIKHKFPISKGVWHCRGFFFFFFYFITNFNLLLFSTCLTGTFKHRSDRGSTLVFSMACLFLL